MPSLRQLECKIETANPGTALREYGTVYGDGVVETYVVIPGSLQPFTIRVTSKGYIYEGLAVLVFMDGEYQCNRNRLNLRPPQNGLPVSATEINFHLRQKEKPAGSGTFIGREWRFDIHNSVPTAPQDADSGHFDSLGTIEILVLRCRNKFDDDIRSTTSSGLDGDPLGKCPEVDDSVSESGTISQEKESKNYLSLAVTEHNDGGGMWGIFDGANDEPFRPALSGDGAGDGFWTYHPYPQGSHPYPQGQQWGPQPAYGPSYPPPPQPPQVQPQQHVPEKHVHFDMGGPPNTRIGPVPRPGPPQGPPPIHQPWSHYPAPHQGVDASSHGGGQQGGYTMPAQPVPFNAVPPFTGHQMHPAYGMQAGWGGQNYLPYATQSGYRYGYGGLGFVGNDMPGHYPGYGQYYPGPMQGPGSAQNGTQTNSPGFSDPAKDSNNQGAGWGSKTDNANTPGGDNPNNDGGNNNAGGGDSWGDGDNNSQNDNASNAGGDDNGSVNDHNNNGTWGEDSGNNSGGGAWGGTVEVTTPAQNDDSWNNNNSRNDSWNNDNSNNNNNQENQSWGNENSNGGNQGDTWNNNATSDQPNPTEPPAYQNKSSTPMPGSFPPNTTNDQPPPRALYGPHGPYFILTNPSNTNTKTPHSPTTEEEPRYDVPFSHIARTGSTHQVQPGRGYLYLHRRATPAYIDTIECPYARFVFKYRTKAQLAHELGVNLDLSGDGGGAGMIDTSDPDVADLAARSKEEVIAMLLRAKAALPGGEIPAAETKDGMGEGGEEELRPVKVPPPERRRPAYRIPARVPMGVGVQGQGQGAWQGGSGNWGNNHQQGMNGGGSVNGNNSNPGNAGGRYGYGYGGGGGNFQNPQMPQGPPGYGNGNGSGYGSGGGRPEGAGERPPSPVSATSQQQSNNGGGSGGGGNDWSNNSGGGGGGGGGSSKQDVAW